MKFDTIYDGLIKGTEKLALVGLGYVGMPIAVEFAKHISVIGFDINEKRVNEYASGIDATNEVGEAIKNTTVEFTSDPKRLKEAKFIVVAVPTPVNPDTTPDLRPVEGASRTVGQNLTPGAIVVFESTVYPGVTEDICVPIIEKESGLKCGVDWKIGYSPERINPGDRVHTLTNIRKIVSGMDEESAREIKKVYDIVIKVGTFPVSTIKTAEAVKVVENSQRDINIAFMNELSIIFNKMGIDTLEVLEAAGTKWNFLPFRPGLVGGHCIGVDPYYLTYKAETLGYHSQVILSGRRINDDMGKYVAEQTVKQLIKANKPISSVKVGCLGITFKEDCPDVRNSKVNDILKELHEYGIHPLVCDPVADAPDAKKFYNVDLVPITELLELDCLIIAVAHQEFKTLTNEELAAMFKNESNGERVLIDVKGVRDRQEMQVLGYRYWRL